MGATNEIMVSIICNAYNHEPYIRDALEGFVMQKTDFVFEILIHDDASTDKTADIIREYEAKYPDLIKPIYQTENQYSKGIGAPSIFQHPRVKGKYIALCEGDDYWTDPLKLQKQYDAMEAHTAIKLDAATKQVIGSIEPRRENTIIPVEDVIYGEGGFVATNSLFYRAALLKNMPEFRKILTVDYTRQIEGSLRGGMLYLKDCMSAYRFMTPGSWTARTTRDIKKAEVLYEKKQKMLEVLNQETHYKYDACIRKRVLKNEMLMLLARDDLNAAVSRRFKKVYKELPAKRRFFIRLRVMFPFLVTLKRKILKRTS